MVCIVQFDYSVFFVYLLAKKFFHAAGQSRKEETIISLILNGFGKIPPLINGIVLFIGALASTPPLFAAEHLFASLEKRLIDDGLNADFVQAVYRNPAVKLELHIMAGNITRSEKTLDYQQFLTDATVARAKQYRDEHSRELEGAYRQFGVPASIIVAILMLETRLGAYTGKHLTINVLSTMAVASDPQVQKRILDELSPHHIDKEAQKNAGQRLQTRAARGYNELKSYLEYVHKSGKDPFTLKGSSEGAIGICQFLPSNISHYGRDADGDGIIDLFSHDDAIASAASFLHAHQWEKARTEQQKKKVLLSYNRSVYYADTVYALAVLLDRAIPTAQ